MSLYQKHRPKSLSDFCGNRMTVEALESVLADKKKMPHAFLFTGPSGCGKTTLARIVASAIGCGDMDFKEMNTSDFRGIDTVRDILRQMTLMPSSGSVRVWLIDEAHGLTKDAQNAILKALEDAPPHVYFMLATTDPQKLLKTIITRCMEFKVQALAERQLIKMLKDVIAKEDKNVSDETLDLIAKESLGSSRAALVALQKVMDLSPDMQAKAVEKAMSEENQSIELCRALVAGKKWNEVGKILKGLQEQDVETVRRSVLGYCNSVLLSSGNQRAANIIDKFQYPTYDAGWPQITAACYALTEPF